MEGIFKFKNGQRLFFQGKNGDVNKEDRCCGYNQARIYEGKVIGCELSITDLTPDELLPTTRVTEIYTLLIGAQKAAVRVPAEHLRTDAGELTPLTITYLYDTL